MIRPVYTSITKRMMGNREMWRLEGHHLDENGEPVKDAEGNVEMIAYDFPTDTMEWRAAEYDLDPEKDKDTLLDIVMAEAWMTQSDYLDGEPALYDCPDVETARKHHIARCSRAKLKQRLSTRKKGDNPMLRVRDESPMHPEILEMKRAHVEHTRKIHQPQVRKLSADPEAHRLEQWRQMMKTVDRQAPPVHSTGDE